MPWDASCRLLFGITLSASAEWEATCVDGPKWSVLPGMVNRLTNFDGESKRKDRSSYARKMQASEHAHRARVAAQAADTDVRDYETTPTLNATPETVAIAHARSTGKGLLIAFSNGVEAFIEVLVLLRLVESGEGVTLLDQNTPSESAGPHLLLPTPE